MSYRQSEFLIRNESAVEEVTFVVSKEADLIDTHEGCAAFRLNGGSNALRRTNRIVRLVPLSASSNERIWPGKGRSTCVGRVSTCVGLDSDSKIRRQWQNQFSVSFHVATVRSGIGHGMYNLCFRRSLDRIGRPVSSSTDSVIGTDQRVARFLRRAFSVWTALILSRWREVRPC